MSQHKNNKHAAVHCSAAVQDRWETGNCGNIEMCYKICRDAGTSSCQAWTYDLTDRSCKLYKNRANYNIVDYNTKKVISGPNQCLQGSWINKMINRKQFARITMNSSYNMKWVELGCGRSCN